MTILLIGLTAVLSLSCRQPQQTATPVKPAPTPQNLSGPPGFPPPVMNKPYPGTGVVGKVNRNEGWVEIDHEEIKDLMPAMQMEFNVKDKSLLNDVKAGDRVNFTIVETEKGEFLTAIKKVSAR
ncbi:MAG: copper-binding protein [Pyrinomonadaceae bacterium]